MEDHHHCIALFDDGSVYSWGKNNCGQLGNGTTNDYDEPMLIKHLIEYNIVDICCGSKHSLALTSNGRLFGIGDNRFGQCGNISSHSKFLPIELVIPSTSKVLTISCGHLHSVALTENGEIFSWGCNRKGQLGVGDKTKRYYPTRLEIPVIKKVVSNGFGSWMLSIEGDIYFCGKFITNDPLLSPSQIIKKNPTKFIDISGSIHSDLTVALSTNNNCYIIGAYKSYYGSQNLVQHLTKTRFTSINKTIAFYDQISFKSIATDSKKSMKRQNLIGNRFLNIKELGTGNFSRVLKCRNIIDRQFYAIKEIIFEPKNEDKIKEEVVMLSALKSEFVVKLFDSWVENNLEQNGSNNLPTHSKILYIQLELCSHTLREAIKLIMKECFSDNSALSLSGYYTSSELFYEILECVNYLHSHDPVVIHRDLKPENILLTNFVNNKRFVKLTDFGLSTFHRDSDQSHTKYIGTKNYKAHELNFSTKYTSKIDIFSLGIILQELLSIDINVEKDDYIPVLKGKMQYMVNLVKKMLSSEYDKRPNCDHILKFAHLWRLSDKQIVNKEFKRILSNSSNSSEKGFVENFILKKISKSKIV